MDRHELRALAASARVHPTTAERSVFGARVRFSHAKRIADALRDIDRGDLIRRIPPGRVVQEAGGAMLEADTVEVPR